MNGLGFDREREWEGEGKNTNNNARCVTTKQKITNEINYRTAGRVCVARGEKEPSSADRRARSLSINQEHGANGRWKQNETGQTVCSSRVSPVMRWSLWPKNQLLSTGGNVTWTVYVLYCAGGRGGPTKRPKGKRWSISGTFRRRSRKKTARRATTYSATISVAFTLWRHGYLTICDFAARVLTYVLEHHKDIGAKTERAKYAFAISSSAFFEQRTRLITSSRKIHIRRCTRRYTRHHVGVRAFVTTLMQFTRMNVAINALLLR